MEELPELAPGLFLCATAPRLRKPKLPLAPAFGNGETIGSQAPPVFPQGAGSLFEQAFDAVAIHAAIVTCGGICSVRWRTICAHCAVEGA